jgi:hypothetical protein
MKSQHAKVDQQNRKLRASMKTCTFAPKPRSAVSPPSSRAKSGYIDPSAVELRPAPYTNRACVRLAESKDYSVYEAVKQQRDQANQQAEMAKCTFAPVISPNSRAIQRSLSKVRSQPLVRHRVTSRDECTFRPSVSRLKRSMEKAKDYVSDDAFRRLYQVKATALHQKAVELHPEPSRSPRHLNYPEVDRPFFERQALYELKKREKAETLLRIPEVSSPRINEASKLMVKGSFEDRNAELIRKRQELKPDLSACTFKPQITDQAKSLRNRSSEERSQGDTEKRLQNLEKLKAVKVRLEREKTRSSMLQALSPRNAQSTLKLLSHPETYVERLNEKAAERTRSISQLQVERSDREMEECTFAPKVLEYPKYLRLLV